MKLADYIRIIPEDLRTPNELRSWATLLRTLIIFVFFEYLLFLLPELTLQNAIWNFPLHLILIIFAGLGIVGMFVLGHDCGHYAFSRHRWINDLVGFMLFIPLCNSFFAWRAFHNFHHQNNQTRKVDPDWPELLITDKEKTLTPWHQKLAIRLGPGSPIGLFIGFWVGMLKRNLFSLLIPQKKMTFKDMSRLYSLNLISALASAAFVYYYYQVLGQNKLIVVYLLPVLVAASTGAFLTFIQHSHPESYVFDKENFDSTLSQVHSTVNVTFPKLFEYLWLDINIHVPHHILPSVPWYHLKTANNLLKERAQQDIREVKFSYQMMEDCWKATRLIEVGPGVYQQASRSSIQQTNI